MIHYTYTILYVENIQVSMQFYQNAFGFEEKLLSSDHSYGEIKTGSTILAFAQLGLAESNLSQGFSPSRPNQAPFGFEIGFTTQEVEKTVQAALNAGATLYEEVKTKPWGQDVAYVRDPDGFLIEICTPIGK